MSFTEQHRANATVYRWQDDQPRVWYLTGFCPYFAAIGIQSVLYPWVLTQVLHESAARVGVAQMLTTLPMLLLVLFGGAIADRRELRTHLVRLQSAMGLLPLLLAALALSGRITYSAIIAVSMTLGALGAFIVPARDAMLSTVGEGRIQQTITAMTSLQFSAQIAGLAAGGGASLLALWLGQGQRLALGAAPLLLLQGALVFAAAWTSSHLPHSPAVISLQADQSRHAFAAIKDGVIEVWRSHVIRPTVILMFSTSVLYTGVFLVQIPVLVRDVYHGGSGALAALNISFMAGTIVTAITLRRYGLIRRQGRAFILASCGSGIAIGLIALQPPFTGMCAIAAMWGMTGGIAVMMSRTLVQGAAPPAHRARVLSIFQLGYMGGAPFGAITMGFIIEAAGPVLAGLVPAACMVVVMLCARYISGIWNLRHQES